MATSLSKATLLINGTVLYHGDNDRVTALRDTDILVEGNIITKIGPNLANQAPQGTEIVDCTDKIISPGFVDTHHHLWQTQLKGRFSKDTLLDYFCTAAFSSYNYEPEDTYWGQLAGALESINAGTTTVVDHAHGCRTVKHAHRALDATATSGLRCIFAYAEPTPVEKWDKTCCVPSMSLLPEETLNDIIDLAKRQPFGDGRVQVGFGFDYYFLPKEIIVGIFKRLGNAGIRLFTSHVARLGSYSSDSTITLLHSANLLPPTQSTPFILSHCTGLDDSEKDILRSTQTPISTTTDTESKMGMGWPLAFTEGINYTFGVDAHSINSASIVQSVRGAIGMARQQRTLVAGETVVDGKKKTPTGDFIGAQTDLEKGFTAATLGGARAIGLGNEIGSIKVGKKADLVLFDAGSVTMATVAALEPLVAVGNHSEVSDVVGVMIDGIWRKREGALLLDDGLTWETVRKELLRSQREIVVREKGVSYEKAQETLYQLYHVDREMLEGV